MVELRVTIEPKLNKILDKIVEAGIFKSKAELLRFGAVSLLIEMGILKEYVEKS